MLWRAICCGVVVFAVLAEENKFSTRQICTVVELAGGTRAVVTLAESLWVLAELLVHPLVKNVKRPFPESFASEFFGVTNYPAVNLVHLFESTIFHNAR